MRLDLFVAGRELLLVEVDELDGLAQLEQMLRSPIALKSAGDTISGPGITTWQYPRDAIRRGGPYDSSDVSRTICAL